MQEMALMLAGRRKEFRHRELVEYLGKEKLQLTDAAISEVLQSFQNARAKWEELISISFLSDKMKKSYIELLNERLNRILP